MAPAELPEWRSVERLADWHHQLVDFYPDGWSPFRPSARRRGIVLGVWSKQVDGRPVGYVRIRDLQGLIHPAIPLRLVTWLRQATPDDLAELRRAATAAPRGGGE